MRVALVNCDPLPEPDPDEAPLLEALVRAGHEASTLAWNRPGSDPSGFDCCLLRATWDYYHDLDAFTDWLAKAASTSVLLNPPDVIEWNAHKGYLETLERAGVSIVPTEFVPAGGTTSIAEIHERRDWNEVVIKPAVGAGSFMTRRFGIDRLDVAGAFLSEMTLGRDALVQLYLPSAETTGERSIVCIEGEPSHAALKQPRFSEDDESVVATELTETDKAFAFQVLDAAPPGLLYARVDLFESEEGEPLLSEFELIEPSLYFELCPGSADRFVRAVEARLGLGGCA